MSVSSRPPPIAGERFRPSPRIAKLNVGYLQLMATEIRKKKQIKNGIEVWKCLLKEKHPQQGIINARRQ